MDVGADSQADDVQNNTQNGLGAKHREDEHNEPEGGLDDVRDQEEARREGPSRTLDDRDEVEDEAQENDGLYNAEDRDHRVNAVGEVVLVVDVLQVTSRRRDDTDCEAVETNLDDHDKDADHPEGDEHPLQEGRIADLRHFEGFSSSKRV